METTRVQPYSYRYMIGTRYGGGRKQTLKYSCPLGMTESDLHKLFPTESEYRKFSVWMAGQTMTICEATRYHHNRIHTEHCLNPGTWSYSEPGEQPCDPDSTEYTWRCGYDGGYTEPSECADNPHGFIVYAWDVAQYLGGGQPLD